MGRGRLSLLAALLVAGLAATAVALANVSLTKVSTDTYANTTSQHQTEVEPDTFSIATATGNSDFDKNWIACDNTSASAFYGRCYVEWDDFGNGNQVHVAYSSDGGQNWTQGSLPSLSVIGGQPVVQPNGKVVMPIDNGSETSLMSLVSANGGVTWSGPYPLESLPSLA